MTGTWLTIYANSTQHDTHREKDTQPETIKIDMKKYECNLSVMTLFCILRNEKENYLQTSMMKTIMIILV